MSSKKAMKSAQKQAFAKHRSNITNSRFGLKSINFINKTQKNTIKNKKTKNQSCLILIISLNQYL